MLKGLEDALAKVLRLPEDKQEVAAELLEQLACGSDPYPLSDEERAIVRDALARARSGGGLASDDQVEATLKQPRGRSAVVLQAS